ncbi:hypothetical protein ACFVGW_02420 [Streptomyces sp. NPDC127129]|uniref:hypothetical protein n=1 Tax=Streptomyces sp. NPDC127129 TaxID=3345373 RepID=UPI003631A5E1
MTVTDEAPQACATCGEPAPLHLPGGGHEFTPAEVSAPVTVLPNDDDSLDTLTAWMASRDGDDLSPHPRLSRPRLPRGLPDVVRVL